MQNDFNLVPGMILRHFKRETVDLSVNPNAYLYEFIGFGVHSETNEPLAIYRALYNSEDFLLRLEKFVAVLIQCFCQKLIKKIS